MDLDNLRLRRAIMELSKRVDALEAASRSLAGPGIQTGLANPSDVDGQKRDQLINFGQPVAAALATPPAEVESNLPPPLPLRPPWAERDAVASRFDVAASSETAASVKNNWLREARSGSAQGEAAAGPVSGAARALSDFFKGHSLEALVGGRLYAVVGALAVVIGIGLFVAWGVEQGWFAVSPLGRCVLAAVAAVVLISGGEVARRRIAPAAATGLHSAGLGVLFITIYGAHTLYGLMPWWASVFVLGLTAVGGVGIALLSRLPVVAMVALIGGYSAPMLMGRLGGAASESFIVPTYVTMLLAVGLVLTARMGGGFAHVRSVARLGALLIGGLWVYGRGGVLPPMSMAFVMLVWAGVLAELCYSTLTRKMEAAAPMFRRGELAASWRTISPLASLFTVSAWACALGVYICHRPYAGGLAQRVVVRFGETPAETVRVLMADWVVPLVLGAASLGLALALGRGVPFGAWRAGWVERDARRRLALVMLIQSSAFAMVTFALLAGGVAEVTGWLLLALAACVAGVRLQSGIFFVYGVVSLLFCTARLVLHDSWNEILTQQIWAWEGFEGSRWSMLMVACAATWLGAGALMLRFQRGVEVWAGAWMFVVRSMVLIASIVFIAALTHARMPREVLAAIWACAAIICAAGAWQTRGRWLYIAALLQMAIASAGFLLSEWQFVPRVLIEMGGIVVTPALMIGIWIAAGWMWLSWCARRAEPTVTTATLGIACAVFCSLILLASFQHQWTHPHRLIAVWVFITCAWVAAATALATLGSDGRRHEWRTRLAVGGLTAWMVTLPQWGFGFLDDPWTLEASCYGVLLAACAVALGRAYARAAENASVKEQIGVGSRVVGGLVLLYTGSQQISVWADAIFRDEQAQHAAVSLLWGACAIALLVVGFFKRRKVMRGLGLGLLSAAAFKGLVLDLSWAHTGWRIVSFIVLGVMMMGVAIAYQRVARLLATGIPGPFAPLTPLSPQSVTPAVDESSSASEDAREGEPR